MLALIVSTLVQFTALTSSGWTPSTAATLRSMAMEGMTYSSMSKSTPDRYIYVHGLHDVAVCYTCCLLHVALA